MLRWMLIVLALGVYACALSPNVPAAPIEPTAVGTLADLPTPTDLPVPASSPAPTAALPDPATAFWAPVVEGLSRPVDLTHAGDERLFVVEKAGRIQIVRDGQLASEPFLDISDRVGSDASEQGLLGLAFHPRFAETGRLFVNYTDTDGFYPVPEPGVWNET